MIPICTLAYNMALSPNTCTPPRLLLQHRFCAGQRLHAIREFTAPDTEQEGGIGAGDKCTAVLKLNVVPV